MIPSKERKEIIERFVDDPQQHLAFSVRQAIEDEFITDASSWNLVNCVSNFLIWLAEKEREKLASALLAKIQGSIR